MHQYDVAMKELFQSVSSGLMERLAGGAPVEWLNVELSETRAPRVDFVCRLKDSSIFHMEFQGLNDPLMVWRMLEYLVAIFKRYGSVPRQVVLYMGNEPLRMANSIAFASLQFQFEIIDVGYPLDSGSPYILWWSTSRLSRISGEQSNHRLPVPRPLPAEPSGRKVCHGCWIAAG